MLPPSAASGNSNTASQRLIVIDDDVKLCRLITDYLAPRGYWVACEHTGPAGLRRVQEEVVDVVLLDYMLPGLDGLGVLKGIREAKPDLPVLMFTGCGDDTDRIVGLEMGADDFVPKAFSPRELLARLRAITRRAARYLPDESSLLEADVVVGGLRLNPNSRVATLNDEVLELTSMEFDILIFLARAKGRVRTRDTLLDAVRDREYEVFDRSIDVHVSSLRRKLGDDAKTPRFIRTIRAVGYMMLDDGR